MFGVGRALCLAAYGPASVLWACGPYARIPLGRALGAPRDALRLAVWPSSLYR